MAFSKAPRFFTEEQAIEEILKKAEGDLFPQPLDFHPSWLLEGKIGDPFWVVKGDGRKSTSTIHFDQPLPDDTNLAEAENFKLLESIQKYALWTRSSVLYSGHTFKYWEQQILILRNTASWLILNGEQFNPKKFGFMLVDDNAVKRLLNELSIGGWSGSLQFVQRLIAKFHEMIDSKHNLSDLLAEPFNLPKDFTEIVINFLTSKQLYTKGRYCGATIKNFQVSRLFVGKMLNCKPIQINKTDNIRSFLRQFEPENPNKTLLIDLNQYTNHPSQNTPTLEEAQRFQIYADSYKSMSGTLKAFFEAHKFLPDAIPFIKLNILDQAAAYKTNTLSSGHHNTLPLSIGLNLLDHACEWITVYGDSIVDATLYYAEKYVSFPEAYSRGQKYNRMEKIFLNTSSQWMTSEIPGLPSVPLVDALKITSKTSYNRRLLSPNALSLMQVIEAYVGACAVLIGVLKPIRQSELFSLPRESLLHSTFNNGAWLEHVIGKKGSHGERPTIQRPIPYIAALAVTQLQRLGNTLKQINEDISEHAEDLFYYPSSQYFPRSSGKELGVRVNRAIDTFCDAIELPVDKEGRRWYARTHELRRFFIYTIYRHEKNPVLDAVGWIAGHKSPKHTDAYIEDEITGGEIVGYEAETVEQRLIDLESGKTPVLGASGSLALYDLVRRKLGVNKIISKRGKEFQKILAKMITTKEIEVEHLIIRSENYEGQVLDFTVAISIGDMIDERPKTQ